MYSISNSIIEFLLKLDFDLSFIKLLLTPNKDKANWLWGFWVGEHETDSICRLESFWRIFDRFIYRSWICFLIQPISEWRSDKFLRTFRLYLPSTSESDMSSDLSYWWYSKYGISLTCIIKFNCWFILKDIWFLEYFSCICFPYIPLIFFVAYFWVFMRILVQGMKIVYILILDFGERPWDIDCSGEPMVSFCSYWSFLHINKI